MDQKRTSVDALLSDNLPLLLSGAYTRLKLPPLLTIWTISVCR